MTGHDEGKSLILRPEEALLFVLDGQAWSEVGR